MADKPASGAGGVAVDDGTSHATGERVSTPSRELAQRLGGTIEVRLLWHPETRAVELLVRDLASGEGFRIDVRPANAIDAFHHPYAYAARREGSYRVVRADSPTV